MSQLTRRNRIFIDLVPNNYYAQLPTAKAEEVLPRVNIAPMQIKKLEIYKSYVQHITEVVVEIDNMDANVAVLWSESKYIAKLNIAPDNVKDSVGFENHFVCFDMEMEEVPPEYAVFPPVQTVSVIVTLKSITRTRLEIENNFPFELGGKNGKGAVGSSKPPKDFLNQDLMKMYNRNYMDQGNETFVPWNTDFCDFKNTVHQVFTTPPNGYRMITDNNFQALEYFFEFYPMFNTPVGWLLDDFNTDRKAPSMVRVSDLSWWEQWRNYKNEHLSDMFNIELPPTSVTSTAAYRTAANIRYFRIQKLEHLSYHDWVRFYTKNGFVKIWAVDVSSGKPIPMNAWNSIHQYSRVLTPTGNVKNIENPMYREYLTFMTSKEIEETQLHLNMFQELNPTMEKYSFANVLVGEIDMHTVVEFKVPVPEPTEMIPNPKKPLDRMGIGYQVLHTYTRETFEPKEVKEINDRTTDKDPRHSQFTFNHSLKSELVFLVVDQGDLSIALAGSEDAVRVSTVIGDVRYPTQADLCIDGDGNVKDRGTYDTPGGTDGVGIPGNTSIGDQAQAMINTGFGYTWGGKTSLSAGIDCSGFTRLAVKHAGVQGYPHGTANQRPWCGTNASLITSVSGVKRGDVLFFNWGNGRSYGHTGIAISSTQFVHSSGGQSGGVGARTTNFANYHPKNMEIYRIGGK